jgi:glycosyltransferase involved in cell wall biosynthesis
MKILLFHPVRLPPKDYGGVERVVLWLAKGLVESGHEVWIGAHPESRLGPGMRLLPFEPGQGSALDLARRLPPGIELVHFMAPPGEAGLRALGCASLLTVHGNGKADEEFPANTVFLSADHARRHGATEFVHNGIDPEDYLFEPGRKDGRYLFLSKTSWGVKNVRGAIRICRRAGVGLRVAGGSRPWDARLAVAFSRQLSWEGPVAGRRKAELLAGAAGLVFPVLWDEPFGLVAAEALMSGTPVLASPRGSLPELIPADVGALPASESEWIERLGSGTADWAPERCRQWALERFHYRVMTANYERIYRRILGGEMLHSRPPRTLAAAGEIAS